MGKKFDEVFQNVEKSINECFTTGKIRKIKKPKMMKLKKGQKITRTMKESSDLREVYDNKVAELHEKCDKLKLMIADHGKDFEHHPDPVGDIQYLLHEVEEMMEYLQPSEDENDEKNGDE